uniref:Uncharacterized protein n=1 Tax=Seriola lalandi dorsalis TaxID=1841481 RepID=A0A3B4WRD0_SERLL
MNLLGDKDLFRLQSTHGFLLSKLTEESEFLLKFEQLFKMGKGQNIISDCSARLVQFMIFTSRCQGCHKFLMVSLVTFSTEVLCQMLIQCAIRMCALRLGAPVAPAGCCVCQKSQGSRTLCSQCDRPACSSCTRQCSSCSSHCCSVCYKAVFICCRCISRWQHTSRTQLRF